MAESGKLHHLWGASQAVSGLYCSLWGTWAYFHPYDSPKAMASAGGKLTMSLSLYIGILVLAASVGIPAIVRLIGASHRSNQQSVDRSDSRLKIISAHYGVEGGPDADVAEKYLRHKIGGDALVGWVGADLFGAFQPITGVKKRLKVHYSFDGHESNIVRPEHALLVLPEDPYFKRCELSSLQCDALMLARKLRALVKEVGTKPHSESDPLPSDKTRPYIEAKHHADNEGWKTSLSEKYKNQFASLVVSILSRLAETGYDSRGSVGAYAAELNGPFEPDAQIIAIAAILVDGVAQIENRR